MTEEFETQETAETPPVETVEVASIKFRNRGKMYYFAPGELTLKPGDKVIVETAKGLEMGNVADGNHTLGKDRVVQPLRPVVRLATEDDLRVEDACRRREREAFVIARRKIEDHGLDMKLVDVECSFEGNKILFFFSSDGRVDFRELVKDLAGVFRTRIELRQIGVRDEARMLGGLGICGRPFCCGTFMDDFAPVSTKMAKIQSMSLNPAKISGCCGRLMCCLRYEQPAYEELVKNVPKNGAFVETPDGYGNVAQVNVLRQTVKVRLDGPGDDAFKTYDAEDVAAIPGGRPRDGSQPPHVLVLKPKRPKEPEQPENDWTMPERLITTGEERQARSERPEPARKTQNRNRPRREGQPAAGKPRPSRPQKQGGAPRGEQSAAAPRHRAKNPNPRPGNTPRTQETGEQKRQKPRYGRWNNNGGRNRSGGAPQQGQGQPHEK